MRELEAFSKLLIKKTKGRKNKVPTKEGLEQKLDFDSGDEVNLYGLEDSDDDVPQQRKPVPSYAPPIEKTKVIMKNYGTKIIKKDISVIILFY